MPKFINHADFSMGLLSMFAGLPVSWWIVSPCSDPMTKAVFITQKRSHIMKTQELPKNLLIPSHIQARLGALLLEYALNHLEDISRQEDYFFAMAWAQSMMFAGKLEVAEGVLTPDLLTEYKNQLGLLP